MHTAQQQQQKKKSVPTSVVSKTLVVRKKTLWLSLQWVRGKAKREKKRRRRKKHGDSGRYNARLQTLCGFVNAASAGTFKVLHPAMSKVERQTGSQDCKTLICAAVVLCFEGACL